MSTHTLFCTKLAGDVTVGEKLVSYTPRGDGPELTLLEVVDTEAPERIPGALHHPEDLVTVFLRNPHGGHPLALVLKAGQPIIVTGIIP